MEANSLESPVTSIEELSLVLRQNVEGEWEIVNPEAELPIEVQQRMEVIWMLMAVRGTDRLSV